MFSWQVGLLCCAIVSGSRGNWNARRVNDKLQHHAAQLRAIGMPLDAKSLRVGETQYGRVRGEHVTDDAPHAVAPGAGSQPFSSEHFHIATPPPHRPTS